MTDCRQLEDAEVSHLPNVSPKSVTKKRGKRWIEFPPRKVRFPSIDGDAFTLGQQHSDEEDDTSNPLKVSAIVCGIPILTEREADFRLSTKVEDWKKFLFLASNVPYVVLAGVAFSLTEIKHHAFHDAIEPYCASSALHGLLALMVSVTSFSLHASQVRVGHWCCNSANARTCHRRRVQDRLDLADCTCASLAVVLAVFCHGIQQMGTQMFVVVPIFAASIVAKKLKWWNLYLVLHSVWHLATAYLLWEIFFPVV
ncbi:hypothetical protein BASA81_001774 [Batrachochytrium salamandrivorans]|nr:hypothetical protein BASA81_001774 [Batrachochytrium salamandrivorans]